MRCPKCGTENPPGRTLCVRCSTRLRTAAGVGAAVPDTGEVLMPRLRADLLRLVVVTAVVVAAAAALGTLLR